MKTHLIFLLFAAVAVAGCDRNEPRFGGSVSGQVVSVMDMTTPVPFSKVVIYYVEGLDPLPDPQYWISVDSTISDQNGEFSMDYEVEIKNPLLFAKGYQQGHFRNTSPTYFRRGSDSIQVGMFPKTYFKVHIKDEPPYDYSRYVGMWLSHTTFVPNDTIYQYPLDTVVVVEGNPKPSTGGLYPYNPLAYSLVYDRPNTVGSLNVLHNMQCAPFDTCEVWINF